VDDQTFDPARIGAELGFTTEELMMNRGGALSDRQRALLQSRQHTALGGILGRFASLKVHEIVGIARTRTRRAPIAPDPRYAGGVRYEVSIGKMTFLVRNQAVLDVFDDGARYRAYYAGGGGRYYSVLLSAERVG
jgi:hypothetical protein